MQTFSMSYWFPRLGRVMTFHVEAVGITFALPKAAEIAKDMDEGAVFQGWSFVEVPA